MLLQIKEKLMPDNHFQILFSTRHLTNWAEGMARYELSWTEADVILAVRSNLNS